MAQSDKTSSAGFPWKEIFVFCGAVLAAYIGYLGSRYQVETPIQATQTAEAKLTLVAQTQLAMTIRISPTVSISSVTLTSMPVYLAEPEQFMREYYLAINNRQYNQTWQMLAVDFQEKYYSGNISGYKDFWNGIKT